jgi:hypothetical protein
MYTNTAVKYCKNNCKNPNLILKLVKYIKLK